MSGPRPKPPKPLKPRLAVDFDGVLHRYSKGWCGGKIYDEPVEGTHEALHELDKRYEMVIFTARTNIEDVHAWLKEHRIEHYFREVTNQKPMAKAYLDDRGVRFENWAEATAELLRAS